MKSKSVRNCCNSNCINYNNCNECKCNHCNNCICPPGPQGIQGDPGPQGNPGPQGIQGEPGTQGSMGPQGIQGKPGPEGAQGKTGPQGIHGDPGIQGIQGIQGEIGPQGVQGPPGPQLISMPIAMFLVNSPNINGTNINNGAAITGWQVPIGIANSSSILVDPNTGIFTLKEAGVYNITASVSIRPGSGTSNGVANQLKYSFVIASAVPSPGSPELLLTGLTTSTSAGGVLNGTLLGYYSANSNFKLINSSSGAVSIINGVSSGTAANISIYKLADQQTH